LKSVTFEVAKGEIFGFLGPNGAGKTTTIRLLLNLLRPTSGKITVFNLPLISHSYQIRKKCGYLPGEFAAYGMMSVNEFITYLARIRNAKISDFDALIERFGFEEALSHKIKHLSHGTRQKLGIIQSFFHQPDLVILDEPTNGLDPLVKEDFYQFLREYQQSGKTIFFSSHNLPEVEKICHRIAIIRNAELVALENINDLKKKRFRKLKIEFEKPIENLKIPGTSFIKKDGLIYEFIIETDIKKVLEQVTQLPVKDVVLPEPTLEEVFLYFYKGQQHD
jgi:ABC-2 type transport system ATP-binding protein